MLKINSIGEIIVKNFIMSFIKIVFIYATSLIIFTSISYAQTSMSPSTGRSNGVVIDINGSKDIEKLRSYINDGKYDKAARGAARYIKRNERNKRSGITSGYLEESYNILCVSYTNLSDIEKAMVACNQMLAINPIRWESLKSRATLYYMTQDFTKSLADFKTSLDNAPDKSAITDVLKQNIAVVESKLAVNN